MELLKEESIYQLKISHKELKLLWFVCNDYLIANQKSEPKDGIYLMAQKFHDQFSAIIN